MRRNAAIVFSCVLLCAGAAQGDPPAPTSPETAKPRTQEQAADEALAAVHAKDDARLQSLAGRDDPDPWLVADELIARGEADAADAFARAAPRVDVEALPAYVASQRGRGDDSARRVRLAASATALAAGRPQEALDALGPPETATSHDVVGVRLAFGRGAALDALLRLKEAAQAGLEAADAAERMGWLALAARAYLVTGDAAWRGSATVMARDAYARALPVMERQGDRAGVAGTRRNVGNAHARLGEHAKAFAAYEQALAEQEALGDEQGVAATLSCMGGLRGEIGEFDAALALDERALALQVALGDRRGAAITLGAIGKLHMTRGDLAKAEEHFDRALTEAQAAGDKGATAWVLHHLGVVRHRAGDLEKAARFYERARAAQEALGDRSGVATTLGDLGALHSDRGEYAKARSSLDAALDAHSALGDRAMVVWTLLRLSEVHRFLGDHAAAGAALERALAAQKAGGDEAGALRTLNDVANLDFARGEYTTAFARLESVRSAQLALLDRTGATTTLATMGLVHWALGDYAKALAALEAVLADAGGRGDRASVARTWHNIGNIHSDLQDFERALAAYDRALQAHAALGNEREAAQTLVGIGIVHVESGDSEKALVVYERALAALEAAGDGRTAALVRGNIGAVHAAAGDYPRALASFERALSEQEALGDRAGVARTLGNIGGVHARLGDLARAMSFLERAWAAQEAVGAKTTAITTLVTTSGVHLALGRPREAAADARRCVDLLERMGSGLAEDQTARVRERFAPVFDAGLAAALALADPAEASFFLETGRAGTLLSFLGGRERLQAHLVPEDLRGLLVGARATEAAAVRRLGEAEEEGRLVEARAARRALSAAREGVEAVVQRIQREARAASDLLFPRVDSLDAMRMRLDPGEALVLYGLAEEQAVALVATRSGTRLVALGETARVVGAVARLDFDREGPDPEPACAALRALVVEPLALPAGTARLLVSPHGALAEVPFAMLFAGEVAYVPSGTTHGLLLAEGAKRGEGVLALGDPDYAARPETESLGETVRGGRLAPLPATRDEAKAVGEVLLLGSEATEAGLAKALRTRTRWRSVHLACHGRIDAERPAFSCLALTPDARDDGFLTCLEVFRSRVPADLVVLSACETARGKVFRSEGILGLTRAFMMAGPPRVLCSLWKVDDEATRALMTTFYELWNPKDGTAGVGTAEALRKAQEFVRSHEKWKHPYYWAAWVLWGLPT